jgi:hypothetical protein
MRGFFDSLVSRRQRPDARLAESEAGWFRRRSSAGSNGSSSPELDIVIDTRRHSPPYGEMAQEECGGEQVHMVGAGNFGVMACSRDDFMEIGASVMDALSRAEAFQDDDDFADAILVEIDALFDELGVLKQMLLDAHASTDGTSIARDVLPLKEKLQRGVNDILARIVKREQQPAANREDSGKPRRACAKRGNEEEQAAGPRQAIQAPPVEAANSDAGEAGDLGEQVASEAMANVSLR